MTVRPDDSRFRSFAGATAILIRRGASPVRDRMISTTISTIGAALLCVLGAIAVADCSGDSSGTAPAVTATTFVALVLNEHALNMALTGPADTVRLIAAAKNITGTSLPDSGKVTFRTVDSSVAVTPDGLVTAHYTTTQSPAQIIAELHLGTQTHVDTAQIRVTATAPSVGIKTFSMQPPVGDSAIRAVGTTYAPTLDAKDSDDVAMAFSPVLNSDQDLCWFATSNQVIAAYTYSSDPYNFYMEDTGHVTLYATSWVYGVSVRDSLKMTIGWPLSAGADVVDSVGFAGSPSWAFPPGPVFLGVGGVMNWINVYGDAMDIIFDDSTAVDSAPDNFHGLYSGSGNVHFPATPGTLTRKSRSFPVAGVYRASNTRVPGIPFIIYVLKNPQ